MASFVQYIIMAGSYWRVFPVDHALLQIDNSNAKIVKQWIAVKAVYPLFRYLCQFQVLFLFELR